MKNVQNITLVEFDGLNTFSSCQTNSFPTTLSSIQIPWKYSEDTVCNIDAVSIGTCGTSCKWYYNHNKKTLTITGTKMNDFHSINSIPWKTRLSEIQTAIIDGPENISKRALINTTSLERMIIKTNIKTIHPQSLTESAIEYVEYQGTEQLECDNSILPSKITEIEVAMGYKVSHFCNRLSKTHGICGSTKNDCSFEYNHETKFLNISGSGAMNDYSINTPSPWSAKKDEVQIINIGDITKIGSYSFYGFTIFDSLHIPITVSSIGESAFEGVSKIRTITIYSNLNSVGKNAFGNMAMLNTFVYLGTTTPQCNEKIFSEGVLVNKVYANASYTGLTSFCQKECDNTIVTNGECGKRMKYITTNKNELIIYGEGEMNEIDPENKPWKEYDETIEKIELKEGIRTINNKTFKSMIKVKTFSKTLINSFLFFFFQTPLFH